MIIRPIITIRYQLSANWLGATMAKIYSTSPRNENRKERDILNASLSEEDESQPKSIVVAMITALERIQLKGSYDVAIKPIKILATSKMTPNKYSPFFITNTFYIDGIGGGVCLLNKEANSGTWEAFIH